MCITCVHIACVHIACVHITCVHIACVHIACVHIACVHIACVHIACVQAVCHNQGVEARAWRCCCLLYAVSNSCIHLSQTSLPSCMDNTIKAV